MSDYIFENEASILAQTYYHTATIYRNVPTVIHGFDDYELQAVYKDIKCAISFTQGSTQGLTNTTQPVEYLATLFTYPDVTTKTGDIVKADVLGRKYEFLCGKAIVYQSHAEVPLIVKEDA